MVNNVKFSIFTRNSVDLALRSYQFIENCYPDLLTRHDDLIYFVDRNISLHPLVFNTAIDMGDDIKCISFFGTDLEFTLFWDKSFGISNLNMHYDFGLSAESCMRLYSIGIQISYNQKHPYKKYYDHVAIERQWIIKNILNNEN